MSFKLDQDVNVLNRVAKAFHFLPFDPLDLVFKKGKKTSSFQGSYYVNSAYNFADMKLKSPDFSINMGSKYNAKDSSSIIFAAPPMISVSRTKQINVTSPDRGEGEVVENFSKRSYEITLKGVIVDMDNHWYPKNGVQSLRHLFDVNATYEVTCDLLNDLGIYALYFTDLDDLSGVEGYADTLSYSMKARSFQPAVLTSTKP